MKKLLTRLWLFLGSFGFVCILLLILMVLTFVGTLQQVHLGLFEVQKRYFESMFVTLFEIGPVPVVFPGVYLTLVFLAVSLLIGGLIRLRRSWSLIGVFVTHIGIAMMLLAGFVKQEFSYSGFMRLFPGDESAEFKSFYHWEISVSEARAEPGHVTEYLIGDEGFRELSPGAQRTFVRAELPFDLTVRRFYKNAVVVHRSTPRGIGDGPVVGDYFVRALPPRKEAELNLAAAYVAVKDKQTGAETEAILSADAAYPWSVAIGGKDWGLDLRKYSWEVPFEIRLENFTHEFHPGTNTPKVFLSDVVMTEQGTSRPVKITMNEPLRHQGYTFYQASYGSDPRRPGIFYSQLEVAVNPSDQWPLYSCIVIGAGLIIHFSQKLRRYVKVQRQRLST